MKQNLNGVALALLIIGGINWGLYGLLGLDLVQATFGGIPVLTAITYSLVGLAALYALFNIKELALPPINLPFRRNTRKATLAHDHR